LSSGYQAFYEISKPQKPRRQTRRKEVGSRP
jgi:hypothetical protein